MVRPAQLLHPPRPPAPLLHAATVLLLRDGAQGLEVLMTRRSDKASFAPGAHVFPGGGIEASDAAAHALAARRPTQSDAALTQAIAAIRESFEELGVLLARRADGSPATAEDIAAIDRAPVLPTRDATPGASHAAAKGAAAVSAAARPGAGAAPSLGAAVSANASTYTTDNANPTATAVGTFAAQCAARGLKLAADEVWLLARWITDRDLPKRFDVPFWVARMPEGQQPVADEAEQFEPQWVRPADALARHAAGRFFMIYPTIRTLERLQAFTSVDAVLAACASEQPLWTSCPRAGLLRGRESRHMEHEPPFGELHLVCPDGQIIHPLDWQHRQPVPLLRNVQRLTAPNGGVMTGPGTNSYLVGDAATGYLVIDPGPDDAAHVQRLFDAARDSAGRPGAIRAIVCTHSHPDHWPAARPLQALCAAACDGPPPPVLGLPSAATARAGSAFTPDRSLQNSERIVLINRAAAPDWAAQTQHTLRVIHTPGHAANHLCLLLEEDGLLFSGDHILNGSTTVIDPPDGDMSDYLDSLDRLADVCAAHGVQFILPAHGHVLDDAPQAIARLKAHRLQREAKVAAALRAKPDGTPEDWVRLAYDDAPPALWPLAQRSLLAHVQRLRGRP